MPFTFAHPAAVLPLRRSRYLLTVPLIIGSITPDLPYFVPGRFTRWMPETHTFAGSFVIDLPLGIVTLVALLLLRRPLTALLPAMMRWRCLRAMERFRTRPMHWLIALPSIVLGAWTHILWDSFTHADGWIVRRVAALSAPVTIGWYTGELCHLLQYVSSVFGLVVLALWYRSLPKPDPEPVGAERSLGGLLVIALVLVAAVVIGGFQALQAAHAGVVYHVLYLLVTRIIAWFAVLYLLAGVLVMALSRGRGRPEPELQS